MSVQIASLQPDQLERNYVCRYDHKSIAMPRGNSANPLTCKPQGRQPLCKPCRQKKGSNCTYVVGEVSRRSVLPTKEIKSLWLDPSVFKNHGHEIKELPLSPLRNWPVEKKKRAEKKARVDMQEENQAGEPYCALSSDDATKPVHFFQCRCNTRRRSRLRRRCCNFLTTHRPRPKLRAELNVRAPLPEHLLGTTTITLPTRASERRGIRRQASPRHLRWEPCSRRWCINAGS